MKLTASLARTWVQDKLVISANKCLPFLIKPTVATNYEKNPFMNFPQIITDKCHQNHFHGPTIFRKILADQLCTNLFINLCWFAQWFDIQGS